MAYPKSVWLIICNEFCERFSYYGLRTVLVLYLTSILRYDDDESTVIYHMTVFLAYFSPLFGAILSDSYLGKFKTILYLSIVYAIGNSVVTGASMASSFSLSDQRNLALLGLILIAIGTGGIKPCVSSFGGDQFDLPAQEVYLQKFFSIFYFSINAGSLISVFSTPELREGVQCFGRNSCFPLAFGVPAVLMIVSILVFVSGKNLYKIKKPESNVIARTCSCIYRALKNRITGVQKQSSEAHWLYYADDKFSEKEISEICSAFDIIYLSIPFPLYWALSDQQGSRWTLQATLMDGRINILNWTMKPDQMQVINPLLILLLIPLFETLIYPILAKIGIRKPLQKMALGGILCASAFVLSAIVQNMIIGESTHIPPGEAQLRLINGFDCNVTLNSPNLTVHNYLGPLNSLKISNLGVSNEVSFPIKFIVDPSCSSKLRTTNYTGIVSIAEGKATSYFLTYKKEQLDLRRLGFADDSKRLNGDSVLKVVSSLDFGENVIKFIDKESDNTPIEFSLLQPWQIVELPLRNYQVFLDDKFITEIHLLPSSVNTLALQLNEGKVDSNFVVLEKGNFIHMAWQLPQIIVVTVAEILFSITSLEFSFTQAPTSMKSLLAAVNLLTVAFGNLIVAIVSEVRISQNQVYEYLFFAGLMVLDMIIFIIMSLNYKYKNFST
ncbi:Major facilitator superfamily domain,Proton-dependent oligopeptide transporter family,PTR2 family [Cinara cedri]|uniref:Oligopeptide transporter 1 n=1 Tax=Cinara cedri TaxID=506608 RepID=A0A5E4MNR2_9HEMI|nr:Major facilitator superfamily domain,Proton-dependent oligopeptide transporter family,PTR2 family [Cinara cedri]